MRYAVLETGSVGAISGGPCDVEGFHVLEVLVRFPSVFIVGVTEPVDKVPVLVFLVIGSIL